MFKVGDLVLCTGGSQKTKRVGVVKKVHGISLSYTVLFFDPPDSNWNNGIWTQRAMELISESR